MRGLMAFMAALIIACGTMTAQEPVRRDQQTEKRTLVGVVEDVDVLRKTVTVSNVYNYGYAAEFPLDRNAEIYQSYDGAKEFRTISDLSSGQRVQVNYELINGDMHRIVVIILPVQQQRSFY